MENSPFLLLFLVHVLVLCRKFELIPIEIGFFMNFKTQLKVHVLLPAKFEQERTLHFYYILKCMYMYLCCVERLMLSDHFIPLLQELMDSINDYIEDRKIDQTFAQELLQFFDNFERKAHTQFLKDLKSFAQS